MTDFDYARIPDDFDPDSSDVDVSDLETVSSMLRGLRRLHGRVYDYEKLHTAELDRLAQQRRVVVGPLARRIVQLETSLRNFARKSFDATGTTTWQTPNGVIKVGRERVPELVVDHPVVAEWPPAKPVVQQQPKVPIGVLRPLLDGLIATGELTRAVRARDGKLVHVENRDGPFRRPLMPDETGVFVEVGGIVDDDYVVPGLSWGPTGWQGFGRSIDVIPA